MAQPSSQIVQALEAIPGQFASSDNKSKKDDTGGDALKDLYDAAKSTEDGDPSDLKAWGAVLAVAKDFDKKLVDGWKEDMQNMLLFAGLFSAVLTTFVIDSASQLQQDSSDLSVQYLAQISQQLSSLKLNGDFLNSTALPASPDPFSPSPQAVRVNTLWFLSLAMSLIAALTAIVAQQWMRAYQDLGYLTEREGVRLRELRYRALHRWRVPEIVNLVSLLLQAALVFFLTGVWITLGVLNNTVFVPYATFVAVSGAFLASTIIMSMIHPTCAYKSPLSYALGITIKTCVVSIYCCAMAGIYVVMGIVQGLITVYRGRFQTALDAWMLHVDVLLSSVYSKMSKAVSNLPLSYTATANEYWLLRERALLETAEDLDSNALSWVLPWLPEDKLDELKRCLKGLVSPEQRLRVVVAWIAQRLNISLRAVTDSSGPIVNSSKVNEHFAARYSHILLDVLPDDWHNGGASYVHRRLRISVLIVLREISKTCELLEASFKENYTKKVIALRQCQASLKAKSVDQTRLPELRLPTVALYECSTILKYEFSDKDLITLLSWAKAAYTANMPVSPTLGAPRVWINALELLLASTATVSDAISRRAEAGQTIDEDIMTQYLDILDRFDRLVSSEPTCIITLARNAEEWLGQGVSSVIVDALNRTGESVAYLVNGGHIGRSTDCPSRRLVSRLCDLFTNQPLFHGTLSKLEAIVEKKVPAPSIRSMKDDPVTPADEEQVAVYSEHPLPYSATSTLRVTEVPRR